MNKIHPTAIVHKDTKIHESVEIGPYSVIGPEVDLDEGNIVEKILFFRIL
jgi:UDP-N-acetylglucosamine acyltransferase